MRSRADGDAGFTLLEILVALAIFALTGVALLGSFSTGAQMSFQATRHANALTLAETRLTLAASQPPLSYGEQKGETEEGLRWRVLIEPFSPDDADAESPFALAKLTVETTDGSWSSGEQPLVRLSTLRFTVVER